LKADKLPAITTSGWSFYDSIILVKNAE